MPQKIEGATRFFLRLYDSGGGNNFCRVAVKIPEENPNKEYCGWVPLSEWTEATFIPLPEQQVVEAKLAKLNEEEKEALLDHQRKLYSIQSRRAELLQLPAPRNPDGFFDPEDVIGGEDPPLQEQNADGEYI